MAFDAHDYKTRNVVERAFNHLKNWRGLATRYDKHALVYRGGVVLASILLWLSWLTRHALAPWAGSEAVWTTELEIRFDTPRTEGDGVYTALVEHQDGRSLRGPGMRLNRSS